MNGVTTPPPGASALGASSKQSDTARELNLLDMISKDLVKVNARIQDKLTPALKSERPKDPGSDKEQKSMSTLATKISEIRNVIEREVRNQEYLYDRIDI